MKMNNDIKKRDKLLGIPVDAPYSGGIQSFSKLSFDKLKVLIEDRFIDVDEKQNEAPSIGTISKFMQKYPKFKAHGYAVHSSRSDYRVSIEGVELKGKPTKQEIVAFTTMFLRADSFIITTHNLFAWYD